MEENVKKQNILGTEKIGKLLLKFSVPGIISMVINALYNIVDQIFIGQGVGYLGNGATNVIFPLTTFAMAFSLMVGDGTASFMSLMLGKKEDRKAARGTLAGLIFTVVSGIVIAVLFLIFLKPLCRVFGATDDIMPYALEYGGIIAIGLPFFAICSGYASIIRADGSPKYNMVGLLTGCVINLIGDPLFIFVFHWGVKGAALATILGQIANAVINLCYIARMKSVKIRKSDFKGSFSEVPQILKLGISSFISQMVLVVVMAVQNNYLRIYGAESEYGANVPISALGVTMKVFNILMVIVIGLASGAQPIWGYNYGARQYKRVQKTFKRVIIIGACVMTFAFVVFQFFPMSVVSIFGTEDEIYNKFAVKTLRIFLLLVPVSGFQLAAGIFFQSVGRPFQASLISLSKQILFSIPAIMILCPLVGVEGVLWSGPVSDLLAFVLTVALLAFSWKSIFKDGIVSAENDSDADISENISEPETNLSSKKSRERYFINGKPLILTIGRSYGAGGREIGRLVAEKLQIPYYDMGIIKEAAAESGLDAMFLAFADEKNLNNAVTSGVPSVRSEASGSTKLTEVQKAAEEAQNAVIQKVSDNGSCVIVGRRADKVLEGKLIFRVFVSASLEKRAESVMKSENLSEAAAIEKIEKIDSQRRAYYNLSSPGMWGKEENYDLCINSGFFSPEESAGLIIKAVKNSGLVQR